MDKNIENQIIHTETLIFPEIGFHANSIKCVLSQERKPYLHGVRMAIFDLYQSTERYSFKILLTLLMDKVAARHCPAFNNAGQRYWTGYGKFEIVGCAHGEIGEELNISHAVGSKLKVTYGQAVLGFPSERSQIDGLHTPRQSEFLTNVIQALGPMADRQPGTCSDIQGRDSKAHHSFTRGSDGCSVFVKLRIYRSVRCKSMATRLRKKC